MTKSFCDICGVALTEDERMSWFTIEHDQHRLLTIHTRNTAFTDARFELCTPCLMKIIKKAVQDYEAKQLLPSINDPVTKT